MELFWIIAPFLAFLAIIVNALKKKKNTEKIYIFKKDSEYNYLQLIFLVRTSRRHSTWWFVLIIFAALITEVSTLNLYFTTPAIPLEKMRTVKGFVNKIELHRKGRDTLTIKTKTGEKKNLSARLSKDEKNRLINQEVKIWYLKHRNKNKIYQLYVDEKPFYRIIRFWNYDYPKHLKKKESSLVFMLNTLYIILISLFIIWFMNKKELPIHRLNRRKLNKTTVDRLKKRAS